jgi:hypothetical protein
VRSSTDGQREHLIGYLRESDVLCPSCGYSLRGCAGERCPECGVAFTLGLVVSRPASMWWYVGLLGAAASVAMSAWLMFRIFSRAMLLVEDPSLPVLVQAGMMPSSAIPHWPIAIATMLLMLATFLLLAVMLASRRRFALWPLRRQMLWGALALATPLLVLGIVALLPRLA